MIRLIAKKERTELEKSIEVQHSPTRTDRTLLVLLLQESP